MGQHPTINSSCPEDRKASLWAIKDKKKYWKGKLEQWKIDVLNETEGWTWGPVEGETWEMLGFK